MSAAARRADAVPHAALGASALFRAYAARDAQALRFYRHDWADFGAGAADAAAGRDLPRDAVADVLAEQNRRWESGDAVLAQVERLRDPRSVAVVTGQQLGLFAGPLYTVYKALSAVRYAAHVEAETGRPAVPVFWLAGEDHDWAEVRSAVFTHTAGDAAEVRRVRYPAEGGAGPVGRIALGEADTAAALDALAQTLPDGPHRETALALAAEAYRPGRTMRDAFAALLRALVPDVVLMSVDDARLKRIAAPVMSREATEWRGTLAALEARGAELRAAGFHQQVAPTPLNLFTLGDAERQALDPAEGGAAVSRDGARRIADLRAEVQTHPEAFSPNVVLRPLVQDALLPTAAYVAGPGEAAYFAQLGPVYDRFDIPMPAVVPRLSLTLVEPGIAKILDRYDLGIADLAGDTAALYRRLALDASDLDLDGAFAAIRARADGFLDGAEPLARALSPSLPPAVGAAQTRVERAIDRLETTLVRAEKRRHADVGRRLDRARTGLWPGGTLQERALCPLQTVAQHGAGALGDIVRAVPLDPSVHHVVRL